MKYLGIINFPIIAGDESSPVAGDIWYNSSLGVFRKREGSVTSNLDTGILSLSAVGSTPNANGLTITGTVLNGQPADGTNPGFLTALTQSIGGDKTFTGIIYATAGIYATMAGSADISNQRFGPGAATGTAASGNHTAIGYNASASSGSASAQGSTAIGGGATAGGAQTTVVGTNSVANFASATLVGASLAATSNYNTLIGYNITGVNNIGVGASLSGGNINIGYANTINVAHIGSYALGINLTSTAANQFRFGSGSAGQWASNIYFGPDSNDLAASYGALTFNAINASNTNVLGQSINFKAGTGTGTGLSGNIAFFTASPGSTGSTANTLAQRFSVESNGTIIANTLASGLTAPVTTGTTKMVISDQNGLLSFQAIPSGGTGTGITRSINNIAVNTTGAAVALTDYVYFCTGGITFTLPTATGNTNDYKISNSGTVNMFVVYSGNTFTLTPASTLELLSDGTNWKII